MSQRITQFAITNPIAYEDSSFTSGDTNTELDIKTDLGRPGNFGYLINDGDGDIQYQIWNDSQSGYSSSMTVKSGDYIVLNYMNIRKIKLIHTGTNSSYRIAVCG